MRRPVEVTVALPIATDLIERISAVSPLVRLRPLTPKQRLIYRDGRPLWAGYQEPSGPDDETEEEAGAALQRVLETTEVLLTNPIVPDDILTRAPGLRLIQLTSAGADRLIDSDIVRSEQLKVTTASGLHAVPISEYVLGTMFAFAKGFPRAIEAQGEHQWRPFWPQELEGATVVVIGFGAIGRRVCELAKSLGMHVIAVRRSASGRMSSEECGESCVDEMYPSSALLDALPIADYVVLALPLTAESRGMIGEGELSAMKSTAVVINIARGGVIDQPALVHALSNGVIAGAALDVTDPEPLPSEHELWSTPNVMITPHISGGTPRYMERAVDIFCDNLERYLSDKPLRNVVDSSRGY